MAIEGEGPRDLGAGDKGGREGRKEGVARGITWVVRCLVGRERAERGRGARKTTRLRSWRAGRRDACDATRSCCGSRLAEWGLPVGQGRVARLAFVGFRFPRRFLIGRPG